MRNDSEGNLLIPMSNSREPSSFNIIRVVLKETAKKSTFLVLVSAVDISAEFLRVYLFSRLGLETLAASSLIYATTKFFFDPFLVLTNQNAVFIAQEYGKTKQLSNALSLPTENRPRNFSSYENIGNIVRQGWYLCAISTIPCATL